MSNIRASLYGRLGSDPTPITTKTGNAMTRASLAVSVEPYNAEQDDTEWFTVLAFGRLARNRWTGKAGEERTSWQLVDDDLHSSPDLPSA